VRVGGKSIYHALLGILRRDAAFTKLAELLTPDSTPIMSNLPLVHELSPHTTFKPLDPSKPIVFTTSVFCGYLSW